MTRGELERGSRPCAAHRQRLAAAPRGRFAQIGGEQIDLIDRNALELAEAHALQIVDEGVGVADEHDGQAIRPEVAARDALDVIRHDPERALTIVLQLLERQFVKQLIEHLRRNRVGRLDGQRKVPDHVGLRAVELAVVDALALQAQDLVDDHPKGLGGAARCAYRSRRRCRRHVL